MDIKPFHDYFNLVKWGRANPILCYHCKNELFLRGDKNLNPTLHCYDCDMDVYPGIEMYRTILDALERDKIENI